jgi:hypothetical protein
MRSWNEAIVVLMDVVQLPIFTQICLLVGVQLIVVVLVLLCISSCYFVSGTKSFRWLGNKYLFNRRQMSHRMRTIKTPFERVGLSSDDDDTVSYQVNQRAHRQAEPSVEPSARAVAPIAVEHSILDESAQKGLTCLYKYFKARNSRNLRKIGDDAPTLFTEVSNCCADPETRELCGEYGRTLLRELECSLLTRYPIPGRRRSHFFQCLFVIRGLQGQQIAISPPPPLLLLLLQLPTPCSASPPISPYTPPAHQASETSG